LGLRSGNSVVVVFSSDGFIRTTKVVGILLLFL